MSEEEMLATLKEIHDSGHRIADERDRLFAVNAALVEALQETRDACAECFRVIASAGLIDELQHHLVNGGIKDGFGKRADEALALAKGEKT